MVLAALALPPMGGALATDEHCIAGSAAGGCDPVA
jgi:hypothetical protein